MTPRPRAMWWRPGPFLGFSKQPKQAEFRTRGVPAHTSPARRRGDGFRPTGRGASLPGRQHPTSTTPGLRARPPLHKGRDSAWPSPPRAPRPAPSPGLRPRPGRGGERKGRAQPLQAAAPAARGAPLAPRTYLWRPRPARAARSPTTAGRPSPPRRRRNPRRPSPAPDS